MSDLVVVGAGAAGCVIASRVSEEPIAVTVLEAGPDYPDPNALPQDLGDGRRNSMFAHDWGYRHRPTRHQTLFPMPRGRVVGGSSAVNTCIALRGHPYDFEEWVDRGLSDWTWDACLEAFKRLEHDLDFGDHDYHGDAGPLPLRRHTPDEMAPWQAAFLEAGLELGFPWCADSNAPGSWGVGPHAMNKIDNRRISAAQAWLSRDVRQRENLRIQPHTLVRRILFDPKKRVRGVEIEHFGRVSTLATRRVVLSAGALATPGILLRSGVGPRDAVERIGVDVVAHNPGVGEQLLDHPGSAIFLRPRYSQLVPRLRHPLIQSVIRYRSALRDFPDTDMQIQAGSLVSIQWRNRAVHLPVVSLMAAVGKPRGRGKLRYLSANPHEKPWIDSQLLEDPQDRAQAVEAMQLCGRLAGTRALRRLARPLWPSPRVLDDARRADAWIRKATDSGYHPCGTVPMGTRDDPDAGCDGRGRVRGVTGLIVADASIMPTVPSGNIHLPTLMIGERFGAWLRDGAIDNVAV